MSMVDEVISEARSRSGLTDLGEEWLEVDLTDEVADRMRTWWASNPADKQGVHDYSPEQYGIDLEQLCAQFAFYNDRFTS